jgi:hypothetical protein
MVRYFGAAAAADEAAEGPETYVGADNTGRRI